MATIARAFPRGRRRCGRPGAAVETPPSSITANARSYRKGIGAHPDDEQDDVVAHRLRVAHGGRGRTRPLTMNPARHYREADGPVEIEDIPLRRRSPRAAAAHERVVGARVRVGAHAFRSRSADHAVLAGLAAGDEQTAGRPAVNARLPVSAVLRAPNPSSWTKTISSRLFGGRLERKVTRSRRVRCGCGFDVGLVPQNMVFKRARPRSAAARSTTIWLVLRNQQSLQVERRRRERRSVGREEGEFQRRA